MGSSPFGMERRQLPGFWAKEIVRRVGGHNQVRDRASHRCYYIFHLLPQSHEDYNSSIPCVTLPCDQLIFVLAVQLAADLTTRVGCGVHVGIQLPLAPCLGEVTQIVDVI